MSDKHLSSRFEADLLLLSTKLLEMGELVKSQIARVLDLLGAYDGAVAVRVLESERRLNAMEIEIDEEVSNVIARRQPAACDLRRLMATSKCVTNLARAGDEARKAANRIRRIHENDGARVFQATELRKSGKMALNALRRALDALAQMDTAEAMETFRDDEAINVESRAFARKLVTLMRADVRTIPIGLEYLYIAKAIGLIGDYATNIAKDVVYAVKGTALGTTVDEVQSVCAGARSLRVNR